MPRIAFAQHVALKRLIACWMALAAVVPVWPEVASANPMHFSRGNFHEIEEGQAYRSAQLAAEDLEEAIHALGIQTVINLRGPNPSKQWYRQQLKVVHRTGVRQIDIPMSARVIPTRENLIKLLDALRDAPRPILIHCMAGVDRTGEAAAIYQMVEMGKPKHEAIQMLSWRYLYFKNFAPAKHYFIESVWQSEIWARTLYQPCDGSFRFFDPNAAVCKQTASLR